MSKLLLVATALSSLVIPMSALAVGQSLEQYRTSHSSVHTVEATPTQTPAPPVERVSDAGQMVENDQWPGRGFAFVGFRNGTCVWLYEPDSAMAQTTQQGFCDAGQHHASSVPAASVSTHTEQTEGSPMVNRPNQELYVHKDANSVYVAQAGPQPPSYGQMVLGNVVQTFANALAYRTATNGRYGYGYYGAYGYGGYSGGPIPQNPQPVYVGGQGCNPYIRGCYR